MYKNKRILAVIPARGGSKGIPRKNIMDFCGKPLISYSIEAARKSKYIDYVLVSTDDEEIGGISLRFGAKVPFLRPEEIANDTAKSIDVVLHGLGFLKELGENFDYVVLLQPTSPLRTCQDIDAALESLIDIERDSLVSVCKVEENPVLMRTIEDNKLKPIMDFREEDLRRQNLPEFYIFNGALYINAVNTLLKEKSFIIEDTIPFVMEKYKSVDIDSMIDVKLAELVLKEKIND